MQENSENTKENFIKNLIKAAKEEIKSISTTTVALVLVCAMGAGTAACLLLFLVLA